jgi:hypothetical protein
VSADHIPIETMALVLAYSTVDLGDERECVLALIDYGLRARVIDKGLDDAIDRARALRTPLCASFA